MAAPINIDHQGQAQAHPQQPEPPKEPAKIEIIQSSTGLSFFVVGASGNKELTEMLKKMDGVHNARMHGFKFDAKQYDEVCNALGLLKDKVNMVDPRRVITVEFTQNVQPPGDAADVIVKLREMGMTRGTGARSNTWKGDLSQAARFLQVFQVAPPPPGVANGK